MTPTAEFIHRTRDLRNKLRRLELDVNMLRQDVPDRADDPQVNPGEVHANLMLAYRHLEAARMRLGKCIQHCEGGESAYDMRPEDATGPLP